MWTVLGVAAGFSGALILVLEGFAQTNEAIVEDAQGGRWGGNLVVLRDRVYGRCDHRFGAVLLAAGFLSQLVGLYVQVPLDVLNAVGGAVSTILFSLALRAAVRQTWIVRQYLELLDQLPFTQDDLPDSKMLNAFGAGILCARQSDESDDDYRLRVKRDLDQIRRE